MTDDRSPEVEALRQKVSELTQTLSEKDQLITELLSKLYETPEVVLTAPVDQL